LSHQADYTKLMIFVYSNLIFKNFKYSSYYDPLILYVEYVYNKHL